MTFPATSQNFTTKTNATDKDVTAVILRKPGPFKGVSDETAESRKLKEIHSWLESLLSAMAQAAGNTVNAVGAAAGDIASSISGSSNSYAYPFPFRR
jgi:hypothetical protein